MSWTKLKNNNLYTNPVEHIYSNSIIDLQEYDRLYENQNNLNHKVWEEFNTKFKTKFKFINDITNIDKNKEVLALWFFTERSDRGAKPRIDLLGKNIFYKPNTFFLTTYKNIKIIEPKHRYIRRPLVQLDMSIDQYNKIITKLK